MPINSFAGDTYVAYSDLNGFKDMMRNHEQAGKALDKFYKTVYALKIKPEYSAIQSLAISDCTINFIGSINCREELPLVLSFLKELHTEMIRADYLITSSVAYGRFSYQERIELMGLDKNMIYGDAYLKAYLNNERCPTGSIVIICEETEKDSLARSAGEHAAFLRDIRRRARGLQFAWAVSSASEIDDFEGAYQDTYLLKYKGMISVYKEFSGQRVQPR